MKKPFTGMMLALILLPFATIAAELETQDQKLSYTIGMDIGNSLRAQGTNIDMQVLFEAIETVYSGGEPALTQEEANAVRQAFISERTAQMEAEKAQLAAKNAAEGDAFLLENRTKEGIMETDSGLQYEVLEAGDGPMPAATDRVRVHYRGTLLSGDEFDSSYSRGEPTSFMLNQVIAGWTEGLQLMPVGSKYKFYIPGELAYGPNGPPSIGPNATLIFEVELLGIEDS